MKWLTSIIGIFNERAKPFAKDTPTSNDPIKPGYITGSLNAIEEAAKDLGIRTCLCY